MRNRRLIRRSLIVSSVILFTCINVFGRAQTVTSDAILACEWLSPDKDGRFSFYIENGKFYGKLVWIKEPKDESGKYKLDVKNPDEAKRKLPLLGMVIFKDFKWDQANHKWVDGKVYDARTGNTWSAEIRLSSNTAQIMEVRGYLLFSWLGQSAYFTRY